jgi:hypothetical protein
VILFRGGSFSDAEMLALLDRVLAQSDTLDLEALDYGRGSAQDPSSHPAHHGLTRG